MSDSHTGKCFCGAVEIVATGKPQAMGFCHCADCRVWSGGPVNAFTLWAPDAVKVTKGADKLGTFNKTPQSTRHWCLTCGGHLFTEHPTFGFTDVYAGNIPSLDFQPMMHVNYAEKTLAVRDGLPKQKDFPKEMGGSGTILPE